MLKKGKQNAEIEWKEGKPVSEKREMTPSAILQPTGIKHSYSITYNSRRPFLAPAPVSEKRELPGFYFFSFKKRWGGAGATPDEGTGPAGAGAGLRYAGPDRRQVITVAPDSGMH
jgi:hypothetical protein